jgi:tRNA (guanine26-N2/guanine27-N2)-dimethyltransferase
MVCIEEGKIRIVLPKETRKVRGPGKKEEIFYNPAMALSRDINVLMIKSYFGESSKKLRFIDGMAGTGIRGLRIARETSCNFELWLNEKHPEAFKKIQETAGINKIQNVTVTNEDVVSVLSREKFDYVDIDPYGSPARFVEPAMRAANHRGLVGITATDLAVLCARYPQACIRRYLSRPMKCKAVHELGLRILIGYVVRMAGKFDMGLFPELSYYEGHHFRVYFKVFRKVSKAKESFSMLGWIEKGENGMYHTTKHLPDPFEQFSGPLWLGPLHNQKLLSTMISLLKKDEFSYLNNKTSKLISLFSEENLICIPFYYLTDEIASYAHTSPPPLKIFLENVSDRGYKASRTHFSPVGVKTDAPLEVLLNCV